jgi:hypothetical protein
VLARAQTVGSETPRDGFLNTNKAVLLNPREGIVELSEYVFEPVREEEEFLLYEDRPRQSEAAPVLLKARWK